jgi:lactate 2-monooxygenase
MSATSTRTARDFAVAGLSRRELMAGAAGVVSTALTERTLARAPAVPLQAAQAGSSSWSERQFDIYLAGQRGMKLPRPVAIEALEARARDTMSREAYDYVAGGAGAEDTCRANVGAFRRWRIVPRMMRDVSQRRLDIEVFGSRIVAPVLLAPIGVQSIIHPDGELAVARAARALAVPMLLSTVSSNSLEDVAAILGPVTRWFQLYWPKNADLATSLIQRAERAGYSALVVTLDTGLLGWRERDLQNGYLPFLSGKGMANYFTDPVFRATLKTTPENDLQAAVEEFERVVSNPALTWDHLSVLRRATRLPIVLKGILHPEDARRAVAEGMEGIGVSNHGGRQVDGAVAALDALPRVVEAVGDRATVIFDSGIRRGADVVKALALGARCVLLGRPYAYGLAVGGEDGVRDVVSNLLADLELTLGLAGCASVTELSPGNLIDA